MLKFGGAMQRQETAVSSENIAYEFYPTASP
ncbi:MAG: hypothetical protein RJA23_1957 [Bacteroidota bacterium]|jgi:hypothetical protein